MNYSETEPKRQLWQSAAPDFGFSAVRFSFSQHLNFSTLQPPFAGHRSLVTSSQPFILEQHRVL